MKSQVKSLSNMLIVEPWRVWVCLLSLVVILWPLDFLSTNIENKIRFAGLIFQLMGISTVAIGIRNTRKLFGKPGYPELAKGFMQRFINIFKRKSVTLSVEPLTGIVTMSGGLVSAVVKNANPSLEERISALEEKLEIAEKSISDTQNKLKEEVRRLEEAGRSEQTERQRSDRELQRKLEDFSVGGLHLESMGLFWLIFGIVLGTIPGEIAAFWG